MPGDAGRLGAEHVVEDRVEEASVLPDPVPVVTSVGSGAVFTVPSGCSPRFAELRRRNASAWWPYGV